uniref:Uncharacterized protein n=1 Tax=Candidatus Kentrum sp. MB TaxID=2138164 RepID=A0A450XZQ9_9GAMM|nr:MAG: hypothetical protein BECKMB1821I_GA0114274_10839 [Candidatus Kentron sp. MB]VFK76926.1 MAG: hypothetical protein BECKMB1821H_GA0114242_10849 [Candidatus Kentron sp. MB]
MCPKPKHLNGMLGFEYLVDHAVLGIFLFFLYLQAMISAAILMAISAGVWLLIGNPIGA